MPGGESDVKSGRFIVGVVLLGVGGVVFLQSAGLSNLVAWDAPLYKVAGLRVTTGMLIAGCLCGLMLIYLDVQNTLAWLLLAVFAVALLSGVLLMLDTRLWRLQPLEVSASLVLIVTGAGLFLSSVRL